MVNTRGMIIHISGRSENLQRNPNADDVLFTVTNPRMFYFSEPTDRPCRMKYCHFWFIVWFKSLDMVSEIFDLWRINTVNPSGYPKSAFYCSLTLYTCNNSRNVFRFNLISHKIIDGGVIMVRERRLYLFAYFRTVFCTYSMAESHGILQHLRECSD